jgi:hypothetical protein
MAFGNSTFSDVSGAVSDLFAAEGDRAKAAGDRSEATDYGLASDLAGQNEKYTETSTAIKEAQQARQVTMGLGKESADVAGAGFAASGSALDLMHDSASQGALTHAVLGQQGLITEAGYTEQQQAYTNMKAAANAAADAEDNAATGATIGAVINGVAAVASLFTGGVAGAAAPATAGLDGLGAIH